MAILKKTTTVFLLPCGCDEVLEVTGGQAGEPIRCPECRCTHQLGSFRTLQQLPSVEKTIEYEVNDRQIQFGLRHILWAFIPFAFISWLASHGGTWPIVVLLLMLIVYAGLAFSLAWLKQNVYYYAGESWDYVEGKD